MLIEPASFDQIRVAADGQLVTITADADGVAEGIRRLDPCLRLRYSMRSACWLVYRVHRHGEPCRDDDPERTEELVLTAQECDQRIVRRLEFIDPHGRGGYDYADALERSTLDAHKQKRTGFLERMSDTAEQTAHALRKDLGLGPYRGQVFIANKAEGDVMAERCCCSRDCCCGDSRRSSGGASSLMTACNRCGAPMIPDETALVPALGCVRCDRRIPRSAVKYRPKGSARAELNRALRASRRQKGST